MSLSLAPIVPAAYADLARYLPTGGTGGCNHSPAALISRAREHETVYAVIHDRLIVRWRPLPDAPMMWMAPIGCTACGILIEELEAISLEMGEPLRIWGPVADLVARMNAALPMRTYAVTTSNAWWDYLYKRESFVTMEGRKLNGKRNFARRFRQAFPEAEFRPLTLDLVPACHQFLNEWYAEKGEMTPGMAAEAEAIALVFAHLDTLGVEGGVLMNRGTVLGFTYGSMTGENVFTVHIEKARREAVGAYPVLAQALAASLPETVELLNREEDLGIPGLRKAKRDWAPVGQLQKGWITIEPEDRGSQASRRASSGRSK